LTRLDRIYAAISNYNAVKAEVAGASLYQRALAGFVGDEEFWSIRGNGLQLWTPGRNPVGHNPPPGRMYVWYEAREGIKMKDDSGTVLTIPLASSVAPAASTSASGKAIIAFANGDATPSVAGGSFFKTANSQPTTIIMFTGGGLQQSIWVLLDSNTTVDFTGTHVKGNNGADFVNANGGVLQGVFDGVNWYCIVQGF
jgi:hypothetical protein